MNFYESNLEIIKKYKLSLYNELINQKNPDKQDVDEQVETLEAKDGNSFVVLTKDSKIYRLNSNYSPIQQAKKWAEQYTLNDMYQVVSMFGFGNGMCAREILHRLKETDMLLIYEPSLKVFMHVLQNYDLADILSAENVSLTIQGLNDMEFHNVIQHAVFWINLHSQVLCQHPNYIDIYQESYLYFLKELKAHNERTIVNRNTVGFLGTNESYNTIHNIKYLSQSNTVMELYDKIPKNVPAIIVAAGPSLDKNVDLLKQAKGKSVIICTDRALNVLLNHNIMPDFVITLDPIKPLKYFTEREDINIPLIYRIEANSEILDFHKGRKFIFHSEKYVKTLFEKLNKSIIDLNPGGSVATAAFSVCISLGFEHVILIGQDLAYGSNNVLHAGEEDCVEDNDDTILVPGVNGDMVKTRYDWISFINWFQDAIACYKDVDVIDATEGGAKLEGSRIMTFQEAIDKYCIYDIDCKKIVDSMPLTFDYDDMQQVVEYVEKSLYDTEIIKNKVREAIQITDKLILQCAETNRKTDKLVEKMSRINQLILKKDIYTLIDSYISKNRTDELANIYKLTGDEVQDRRVTFEKSKHIYNAINDATDEITLNLEITLSELKKSIV